MLVFADQARKGRIFEGVYQGKDSEKETTALDKKCHRMYTMYKVYFSSRIPMRIVSITEGRKQLGELVNLVKYRHEVIALGKNGKADALLVSLPEPDADVPITAINAASSSFRFLADEPDIYSISDLTVKYAA